MSFRLLIVDDEVNHRKALAIGLRLEGYTVLEAEDGRAALELLTTEDVDLAIVDLMMPGITGLDLCRRMRFRHPAVPIVLTSAYHLSQRQLNRADIPVLGFLPKPYEMDELLHCLKVRLQPDVAADAVAG